MRAIPVTYRGTQFRSRLEADYAATFDRLNMAWDYEPEGFDLSDGTRYLPDFWLPASKAWVEVKGDHNQRVTKVEQFAAELWAESGVDNALSPGAPLVVMAQSPTRDEWEMLDNRPRFLGIRGVGARSSVSLARCPECRTVVVIALWQQQCNACRFHHLNPTEAWIRSWADVHLEKLARAQPQWMPSGP